MSTTRAEGRALLLGALGVALALSGCAPPSVGSGPPGNVPSAPVAPTAPTPTSSSTEGAPAIEGMPVPRDLAKAFSGLLRQRSRAILTGDRAAFLATLVDSEPGLLAAQNTYFDNLAQLPVERLAYRLDRGSLVRGPSGYQVVVRLTFQLADYDVLAPTSYRRFRFTRVAGGRFRLSSVADRAWEQANDVMLQPWEQGPIRVRSGPGVLAVFDDDSIGAAGPLMKSVEQGIADVSARVPYEWDGRIVLYALSDLTFLDDLDSVPGEDPGKLDGVAFTVPAGPGDPRVADTRVALNPRVLRRPGAARDRLLRHELTHVAVADHDDFAPTWLSEGLAEWVSVQTLAPQDRRVPTDALRQVEAGVRAMPKASTFNDDDSELHYALAWWSCQYIAATYGDDAPWQVLDAFTGPDLDQGDTVETLLRISVGALARRAAKLMITTYDPAFYDVSPTTSAAPSDEPSPTG